MRPVLFFILILLLIPRPLVAADDSKQTPVAIVDADNKDNETPDKDEELISELELLELLDLLENLNTLASMEDPQ